MLTYIINTWAAGVQNMTIKPGPEHGQDEDVQRINYHKASAEQLAL